MTIYQKQFGKVASLGNQASGSITLSGTAEQYRAIVLNQTTAGVTVSLPAPADAAIVFSVDILNIGSVSVSVTGVGAINPSSSVRVTWDGVSDYVTAAAPAALPTWVASGTYAAGDIVKDPNTLSLFTALLGHTGLTVPPSQDITNWIGWDLGQIGQITIGIPARDRNGYLAMTTGRLISRTTYTRLMNTVAPVLDGIGIVAASNQIRFDPADRPYFEPGYVIEVPGVPANTTLTSASPEGSKVGSTLLGESKLFFRPGVYATGYTIVNNTEVDGPGLDPSSTVNALQADFTASMSTAVGSNVLRHVTPGNTAANPAAIGTYVTGTGIPANSRITLASPGNLNAAASSTVTGQSVLLLAPDAAQTYFNTTPTGLNDMLIERLLTVPSWTTVNQQVQSIVAPQDIVTGSWDWVANTGLFSPWDIAPADFAKFGFGRRRVAATPALLPASNVSQTSAAPLPVGTLNGAVVAAFPGVFWQTGQVFPANFVNRKVGNLSGAIPANAYISTLTNADQTANPIDSINGEAKAFFAIGAATTNNAAGTPGQYLTSAGAGFTQAIVTNVVAQFNNTGTGVVSGSASLFVQPSLPLTDFSVGQRVSGTGIPANTTLTSLGTIATEAGSYWATSSNQFSVQPGAPAYTLNRRVQGTGLASSASNFISAAIAETTQPCIGILGSTRLFFDPAASIAGVVANRILDTAIFAANSRTNAVALAGSTIANSHIDAATPTRMYLPGGATLPAAGVVGGGVRFNASEPGYKYSVINAVQAAQGLAAVSANGSNQVNVNLIRTGTGLTTTTLDPSIVVGRGISGTGIPAGARIGAITKPIATANNAAPNGGNTINNWTGTPLDSSDVGREVSILQGTFIGQDGLFCGVITSVNSPTSFNTSGNVFFNGGPVAVAIGARVSLVDAAGAPLNATSNNGTVGSQTGNLTLAQYLTLAKTATSPGTYTADVLAHVSVVNAAGAATTPTPNADIEANTVIGAVYTLGGNTSAVNNYGTATIGPIHTMSAVATASGNGVSATFGRWITTDAPATATIAATPATFGAIHALVGTPTSSDTTPITYGAWIDLGALATATQRAIAGGVQLGAILTLNSTATTGVFSGAVFAAYQKIDQNATATGSGVSMSYGGHVGVDVPAPTTELDETYNFGSVWTMSANATVTNQAASGRVFPFGAGDGSTTFGVGTGTISVGGTNRTLTIYAGA